MQKNILALLGFYTCKKPGFSGSLNIHDLFPDLAFSSNVAGRKYTQFRNSINSINDLITLMKIKLEISNVSLLYPRLKIPPGLGPEIMPGVICRMCFVRSVVLKAFTNRKPTSIFPFANKL